MLTLSPLCAKLPYGYVAISSDGEHTYVVTPNGIGQRDYTVTHYWSQNPDGEIITLSTTTPSTDARRHYAALVSQLDVEE